MHANGHAKTGILRRRTFLAASATMGLALSTAGRLVRADSPNEQLHIGIVGAGGRGAANTGSVQQGNRIVALCDVDANALAAAKERHPHAQTFRDYRQMLARRHEMDAVVVSTPDHHHALPTLMAIDLDLHVYCEKPLTYTVEEARRVRSAAAEKPNLATQMGIQIQAGNNYRRVVELIESNTIGPVREAHVWVARAWGGGDRPTDPQDIPAHLDWDIWLGGAPERPFHTSYLQLPGWYKFWDFAGGTATDLGSHWNDLPFWALKLDAPRRIRAEGPPVHPETAPANLTVRYRFDERDDLPAVDLYWTQGATRPSNYRGDLPDGWNSGVLFVGDDGLLLSDYGRHIVIKDGETIEPASPEPYIERSPGHHAEWLRACRGGPKTKANFEYAGRLTEMNHLGNIAYRTDQTLTWRPNAMRLNSPEAEALLTRSYRQGWALE